jgi:hypothetical protein
VVVAAVVTLLLRQRRRARLRKVSLMISTVPGGPACFWAVFIHVIVVLFWRCTRLCRVVHAHGNGFSNLSFAYSFAILLACVKAHEKCASVSRPCMRSVVVYSAHTCEARERKNTSFASYFVARAHRHKQGAKMRCVLRPFHHQLCSCIHASLWLCVGCMTAPLLQ